MGQGYHPQELHDTYGAGIEVKHVNNSEKFRPVHEMEPTVRHEMDTTAQYGGSEHPIELESRAPGRN